MAGRLFCFGLGYSAQALAQLLLSEGWAVAGTVRSAEAAAAARAAGMEPVGWPLADAAAALSGATHLLSSVPPDAAGDPVLARHGSEIRALSGLAWVGYLSTTGVYGDRQGALVDETMPPAPTSERGKRRVAAEEAWRALGVPLHIFRLAGIYGPGRSAFDSLRAGSARRVDRPGHLFSRIHVADIAAALRASIRRPHPGAIYNLCDDEPAASADVIAYAAALLGMAPPPLLSLEEAGLSPMAASFYGESRRVSNARIKRELGLALCYPDYRAGLAAILSGETV